MVTKMEARDKLDSAQEFYLAGNYDLAADVYEDVIKQDPMNPYLLNNYANAKLKNKDYGEAIAGYYKAKMIVPRATELDNNLTMALQEVKLKQPQMLAFNLLTISEALIILILANLLLFFLKRVRSILPRSFILIFFLASLGLSGYTLWMQKFNKYAVVKTVSAYTHSGNDEDYQKISELLDGQIIEVLVEQDNWSKIKGSTDIAWIQNFNIEPINY